MFVALPVFSAHGEEATATTTTPAAAGTSSIPSVPEEEEAEAAVPEIKPATKNPFQLFKKMLLERLEEKKMEAVADHAEAVSAKSKFEGFRKKLEGVLKRLNNTE